MTDEELIRGILNKDQSAFKELVDAYQSLVLNTCNSFLNNRHDAEDVTQEVFVEAFLSIGKFRGKSSLSTWLYRISVNKSLNFIRDHRKRNAVNNIERSLSDSGRQNPELNYTEQYEEVTEEEKEKIQLLHKTIYALPEKQRIAFTLSKLEGLSYKQISEVMELSLPAVEGLIHRAKRQVTKKILDYYKKDDQTQKFFKRNVSNK